MMTFKNAIHEYISTVAPELANKSEDLSDIVDAISAIAMFREQKQHQKGFIQGLTVAAVGAVIVWQHFGRRINK